MHSSNLSVADAPVLKAPPCISLRRVARSAGKALMSIRRVPVQHRRLLPDRRLSGPTPWVGAFLMMLTLLAAAAGVGLARSANAIGDAIAGRVTVQIVTANPVTRAQIGRPS